MSECREVDRVADFVDGIVPGSMEARVSPNGGDQPDLDALTNAILAEFGEIKTKMIGWAWEEVSVSREAHKGGIRGWARDFAERLVALLDKLYQAAERDATELAEDYETIARAYQEASLEVEEWRRAALQARADLLAAPADLGLPADTKWVEWSNQANTVRWIDRLESEGPNPSPSNPGSPEGQQDAERWHPPMTDEQHATISARDALVRLERVLSSMVLDDRGGVRSDLATVRAALRSPEGAPAGPGYLAQAQDRRTGPAERRGTADPDRTAGDRRRAR